MEEFSGFIKSRVHISQADLTRVLSKFKNTTVKKGGLVLRKGQIANQYFFIKSGGLRLHYGAFEEQHTSWVFFENDFFTDISSLHAQVPSRFNIEAIENTELLVISKADMDQLYEKLPVWQEFGRKIWEEMCIRQVDQNLNYQTLSAKQIYLELLKNSDFVKKIPIKQLASILGITPNALSRIRKEIK
ncbi:Crp/Fnr family transcriptional regulator [Leeuwenhoekiella aequorea]|uniref:Crp/Fnr family transcriptional regulator n=1 Tax=Leeuwenhoekiella TaxID=283735 RepID=UPI00048DECB5|nr:Crp/Fnr family transcriptional regulator [Leeuwenhoekiella sp. MAR_2009_132]AOE07249.1 cyclic nucleotide-binding protein [uncultured bacterium]|tara:strand:- start:19419 stop:19982 length:564 start_codon:yes stop_codon:yes gene_type:complete